MGLPGMGSSSPDLLWNVNEVAQPATESLSCTFWFSLAGLPVRLYDKSLRLLILLSFIILF